ncbi:hypothetical protein DW1_1108 [Proteiniborus sp. DW1]|uniref:hypothetical protein n=1 Tax=Proteiniborus sp. DW1 TaxID=1889883 RepID=UPI00092E064E|nr:hypothetical protein [Proteiniborus sp. DW1]SCG82681.1 hypothetical protein DW1_1108 [Proteiniborus sp. DW1]
MEINPNRLPIIAKIAIVLFEHANNTIKSNPNKTVEMHFVADMFKKLVNTAFPLNDSSHENELREEYQNFINWSIANNVADELIPSYKDFKTIIKEEKRLGY